MSNNLQSLTTVMALFLHSLEHQRVVTKHSLMTSHFLWLQSKSRSLQRLFLFLLTWDILPIEMNHPHVFIRVDGNRTIVGAKIVFSWHGRLWWLGTILTLHHAPSASPLFSRDQNLLKLKPANRPNPWFLSLASILHNPLSEPWVL